MSSRHRLGVVRRDAANDRGLDEIVARVLDDAGVTGLIDEPTDGVEAVRRGDLMFLFNHTTRPVMVSVGSTQHSVDAHGCTYHEYIP